MMALVTLLPTWTVSQTLGRVLGSSHLLLSYFLTLEEHPALERVSKKLQGGLRKHDSGSADEGQPWGAFRGEHF